MILGFIISRKATTRDAAIPPKKKCRLPLRKNITMLLLDLNLIKANLHA
jgi:hypothetical protein